MEEEVSKNLINIINHLFEYGFQQKVEESAGPISE